MTWGERLSLSISICPRSNTRKGRQRGSAGSQPAVGTVWLACGELPLSFHGTGKMQCSQWQVAAAHCLPPPGRRWQRSSVPGFCLLNTFMVCSSTASDKNAEKTALHAEERTIYLSLRLQCSCFCFAWHQRLVRFDATNQRCFKQPTQIYSGRLKRGIKAQRTPVLHGAVGQIRVQETKAREQACKCSECFSPSSLTAGSRWPCLWQSGYLTLSVGLAVAMATYATVTPATAPASASSELIVLMFALDSGRKRVYFHIASHTRQR